MILEDRKLISKRFTQLLAASPPDRSIAGVLQWKLSRKSTDSRQSSNDLRAMKRPLLDRINAVGKFRVNDFDALPSAVVLAPAREWKRLLESEMFDPESGEYTLDANYEIPLVGFDEEGS